MLKSTAEKFTSYLKTADNQDRAYVDMVQLETLWINSGTLCNIECANCYIESSPKNDRLAYITYDEVCKYLDEIETEKMGTKEIGITGGEPFMNRDMIKIMTECLQRGFNLIVLTNAMQPMQRKPISNALLELNKKYAHQLTIRVSVDHFKKEMHEEERGLGTWPPMLKGLKWLSDNNFTIDIAGRTRWGENEGTLRNGFNELFQENGICLNAHDHKQLVLFPEMDENAEVPEITTECWSILGINEF
jgi:MoaA/NifB/PqqE/SkfB family radical SAM enzyme